MNVSALLEHWGLRENPFLGEEAREDPVFARLGEGGASHPDLEKIAGDPLNASSSVVFGEKGSGKTAIRLQLASRAAEHNLAHPDRMVYFVAVDDLNPMLDRLAEHAGVPSRGGAKEAAKVLSRIALADHLDRLLHLCVSDVVDQLLGAAGSPLHPLPSDAPRRARTMPMRQRHDLLMLAAMYDRADPAGERLGRLKRMLKIPIDRVKLIARTGAFAGWLVPAAIAIIWATRPEDVRDGQTGEVLLIAMAVFALVWIAALPGVFLGELLALRRPARSLANAIRTTPRHRADFQDALARVPARVRAAATWPAGTSDGPRYELIDRLRAVLDSLGFQNVLIVYDRIDEPTLVNGDPQRMRAIVWPLLTNTFLQHEGLGVKLLLPIELRHELFRESSEFFQTARLDKQNLVERLSWTGAMLYDLCNARLEACTAEHAEPVRLADLFEEDVSSQDVVEALDQMRQPRDAFKMIYQCLAEYCAAVTAEQGAWRIPRHVLDSVKRRQAERVEMFSQGVRPA